MNKPARFSVVIPFYNESGNLPQLISELDTMLGNFPQAVEGGAEIILVNDGSTDQYEQPAVSPRFPVRWIDLTCNSGQSAAMYYGMQHAEGEFVILLDADLQNDPADAPKLFEKLMSDRLDLVTGIRTKRQDNWWRHFSSRLANTVRSTLLHDRTSDTGCTLKVLRRDLAKQLSPWNGMHRFIPALASAAGYKTGEIPVNHRPRHAGTSKVNSAKRAVRATVDLIGMLWLSRRQFKSRVQRKSL
jgi:glycosyltransferase involved in cell wall biosynthesis